MNSHGHIVKNIILCNVSILLKNHAWEERHQWLEYGERKMLNICFSCISFFPSSCDSGTVLKTILIQILISTFIRPNAWFHWSTLFDLLICFLCILTHCTHPTLCHFWSYYIYTDRIDWFVSHCFVLFFWSLMVLWLRPALANLSDDICSSSPAIVLWQIALKWQSPWQTSDIY